jgi:GGDEF domain-containing protein
VGGQRPAAGWLGPWVPLAAQLALTLTLAAAVGWQIRRTLQPVQLSLDRLRQQADALEQGRFVVTEDAALPEAVPLSRSLNAAVRRMQSALDGGGSAGADSLRRSARTDPETGLDSRFTFLRKLTERLAERQAPDTAVLFLRLVPPQGSAGTLAPDDEALGDLAEWLRVYPQRVPDAFVGRLTDTDFGLCLPAHGVVGDSANSLMAAARAAPGHLRCVIGGVDHLGGVSLGSALAMLDMAVADAESAGAGRIECRRRATAGRLTRPTWPPASRSSTRCARGRSGWASTRCWTAAGSCCTWNARCACACCRAVTTNRPRPGCRWRRVTG